MAYTTINKSTDYFNTKLYTGNGSAGHAITGVGHQPDLTWLVGGTLDRCLFDAVRGVSKRIRSNTTNAEDTTSGVTAFDTDGFTLGSSAEENQNGTAYTSWNWKANGQGSSNTAGSINTTYTSANTTSGFSIIKYPGNSTSGATIGHGLGVAPKVVIVKALNSASYDWGVYHASLGNTKNLRLNLTDAEATSTAFWNDTTPTSTLVYLGSNGTVNADSINYVAYCFAEVKGFSKFGLYEANGNADGPFIYTGFKPGFVMIKAKGQTESWYIMDTKRPGYNTNNYYYKPNNAEAQGTSTTLAMSLLSNGFKINNNDTSMNSSGQGYVYFAFAAAPLVGSNNIPANAR